ncbi:hypothetical protein E4U17_002697 [Claviceps sp. LM77 group G4]|nr:hypothetical protein E4U17_002697 [Claviceps sp. LM77 group G4]KAG6071672.1 hypothetical protein E4U33_003531 [Claviceps sp. LM78 group G4]KAG6074789.1 hypothetical protein E4U16_003746 [Claviceps sp. LM84 group G4]
MISNSFSAARTAVRDLFRSTNGRRNRENCWAEPPDEWGLNTAGVASSAGDYSKKWAAKDVGRVASDETFFTSKSWQSNDLSGMCDDYEDGPEVSMDDNVVIQEGPRRNVRHVRSSPAVEERYLILERVPAPVEKDDEPVAVESSHDAAPMDFSPPGTVTVGAGERDHRDEQPKSAHGDLGCRRITASMLFAYKAMNLGEQGEDATRLPEEAAYSEGGTAEMDALLQDCAPQSIETATEDYLSTIGVAYRHDGMYTSPMKIQPIITDTSSDFARNYDISDSEGSSSGRISPRTFRVWATGCSQQSGNTERKDVYPSACGNYESIAASDIRPETGDGPGASGWSSGKESQPCWKRNRILEWHDRMSMPHPRPKYPSLWPLPPGQVINLTNPTILSALSHPSAPSHLADVPLAYIPSALHHRYQLLNSSRHAEAHLMRLRDDAQARINYLLTARNMAETSPSTIDSEEKEGPKDKQRREEIYRHLEGQLQDVAGLCEDSQGRVRALAGEVEWLMGRERILSGCEADAEQ